MASLPVHFIALVTTVITLCACSSVPHQPSAGLPSEKDTLTNKGSDTIVNLALAWAEAYHEVRPDINISVTGGGSGTGIAAMINNTVDIANASRRMKNKEIANAEENGITPVEFVIARDGIAVIVNPKNPVDRLTLQQVSDIFSGNIVNWTEVGGEDRPIVRLSREVNSGTHVYFLEAVVRMGDKKDDTLFSTSTLLLPSSEGITAEIAQNRNAIGYDGLGYVTDAVKTIALAPNDTSPYVSPTVETVMDGSYPVSRSLYMYTPGQPRGETKDYLDWLFGPDAQAIVRDLGFVPLE
ncbi:MAG: phosphate ABC transporter substrate-binding protein [Anaerolineales bacterium]|nr:phosphate ABC transporter substrate-binding protein [Anaerolineales bacterium]